MGKDALDAAAQKLGMTTQELMTALRNGKSLTDVAKAKNVSVDDLKTAMVAAVKAGIDKAVADGKLTKDQADKLKAQVNQADLDKLFGGSLRGGHPSGPDRGGFKGMRPFGGRGTPTTPTTP
jgi:hypothetical protein